jgi:FecR protein
MTSLVLAFMMQYVVATKAGLVNDVKGLTNVKPTTMVEALVPVRTGPNGFVELLLTPGAYLRLGPNSEAVLDSVALTNVAVRVTTGEAVIEVVEIDNEYPLRVTTGETSVELSNPGIFAFKDGTATVLEGRLSTVGDEPVVYKKGWAVAYNVNYRARKVSDAQQVSLVAGLDQYSLDRSSLMARANVSLVPIVQRSAFNNGANAFWLYSPMLGALTYMPLRNVRSPYGFAYYGWAVSSRPGNTGYSTANSSGPGNASSPNSSNSNGNSSSGSNVNSSGQTTFSVPSSSGERMTRGEIQAGKAPPAPVLQPRP